MVFQVLQRLEAVKVSLGNGWQRIAALQSMLLDARLPACGASAVEHIAAAHGQLQLVVQSLIDDAKFEAAVRSSVQARLSRGECLQRVLDCFTQPSTAHTRDERLVKMEYACQRLANIAGLNRTRSLARGLGTWKVWVAADRVKAQQQSQLQSLARRLVRRCVSRMRQRSLAAAWLSWTSCVEDGRSHAMAVRNASTTIVHALLRAQRAGVWKAFHTWRSHAALKAASTAVRITQTGRGCSVLRRLLCRWRQRDLSLAWQALSANRAAACSRCTSLARIVARFRHQGMSRAWQRWRLQVARITIQASHTAQGVAICRRAVARMRARALARAFQTWARATTPAQNSGSASVRAGAIVMSALLAKMSHLKLYRGWRRLRENALGGRETDARMRGVLCRVRNRYLGSAWNRWVSVSRSMAAREARSRQGMAISVRVVRRMQQRSLWQGWRRWVSYTSGAQSHEARSGRRAHIMTRVTARMRMRAVGVAFTTWATHVTRVNTAADAAKRIGRCVSLWRRRVLARSFGHWRVLALQYSRHDAARHGSARFLRSRLQQWRHASLARAWRVWTSRCRYCADGSRAMRRVRSTMCQAITRRQRMAFHRWTSVVRSEASHDRAHAREFRAVRCLVRAWRRSRYTSALRRWRAVVSFVRLARQRGLRETVGVCGVRVCWLV